MTRRVFIVPAVIVLLTVAGVVGAKYISVPTLTHVFNDDPAGSTATAVLTVDGVGCYGMADFLRQHIESVPGLVSMVAYGGKHRVVIEYSPQALDLEDIISAIEEPVLTDDGPMQYFQVVSHEIK